MISVHAEVPGSGDIYALHDVIDNAEYELSSKLGCLAVIHMDPVCTDNSKTNAMHDALCAAVRTIDSRITIHDFRIVTGRPTPTSSSTPFCPSMPRFPTRRPEFGQRQSFKAYGQTPTPRFISTNRTYRKSRTVSGSYYSMIPCSNFSTSTRKTLSSTR
jgi:hypothetical protein